MDACPVCMEAPRRAYRLACGHHYCDVCLARTLWDKTKCAVCRSEVTEALPAWDLRVAGIGPAAYAAQLCACACFELELEHEHAA